MSAAIELAPRAENNGLACMLAEMLSQSLADKPHKLHDFERLKLRAAIVAEDAGVALTLHFQRGKLTVHDGIVGIPDVTIRATSEEIMNLSLVELRKVPLLGEIPDGRGAATQQMQAAEKAGRIKIYGALAHAPQMLRLTRVMSVM